MKTKYSPLLSFILIILCNSLWLYSEKALPVNSKKEKITHKQELDEKKSEIHQTTEGIRTEYKFTHERRFFPRPTTIEKQQTEKNNPVTARQADAGALIKYSATTSASLTEILKKHTDMRRERNQLAGFSLSPIPRSGSNSDQEATEPLQALLSRVYVSAPFNPTWELNSEDENDYKNRLIKDFCMKCFPYHQEETLQKSFSRLSDELNQVNEIIPNFMLLKNWLHGCGALRKIIHQLQLGGESVDESVIAKTKLNTMPSMPTKDYGRLFISECLQLIKAYQDLEHRIEENRRYVGFVFLNALMLKTTNHMISENKNDEKMQDKINNAKKVVQKYSNKYQEKEIEQKRIICRDLNAQIFLKFILINRLISELEFIKVIENTWLSPNRHIINYYFSAVTTAINLSAQYILLPPEENETESEDESENGRILLNLKAMKEMKAMEAMKAMEVAEVTAEAWTQIMTYQKQIKEMLYNRYPVTSTPKRNKKADSALHYAHYARDKVITPVIAKKKRRLILMR